MCWNKKSDVKKKMLTSSASIDKKLSSYIKRSFENLSSIYDVLWLVGIHLWASVVLFFKEQTPFLGIFS